MVWKTKIPYRLIDFTNRIHPADNYIIGVRRISDSGGAGTWVRIDELDNVVDVPENYFVNHPTYQFKDVVYTDMLSSEPTEITLKLSNEPGDNRVKTFTVGNYMVQIPKFYVKSDSQTRFWIAPEPDVNSINYNIEKQKLIDKGFHVHPAFMSNGKEIDYICIGKYQGYIYPNNEVGKMWSVPFNLFNVKDLEKTIYARLIKPTVYVTHNECYDACDRWNTTNDEGGVQVNGYHMMTIYDYSVIQWLSLIELAHTNAALPVEQGGFGAGNLKSTGINYSHLTEYIDYTNDILDYNENASKAANFHGIIHPWGNIWQYVYGLKTSTTDKLMIIGGLGYKDSSNKINDDFKMTEIDIPVKAKEKDPWTVGVTKGFYKNRQVAAGYLYDFSDLFIPDFKSITHRYNLGSYSDGIYMKTANQYETMVAVGGSFDTDGIDGDSEYGGLYCYRFDLPQNNVGKSETGSDYGYRYYNVGSRLCYAPVNLDIEIVGV